MRQRRIGQAAPFRAAAAGPIRFTVYGRPAPSAGERTVRLRGETASRTVNVEGSATARAWKNVAREHMTGRSMLRGPVEMECTFYLRRPKSHYGSAGLKSSAPAFPVTRPSSLTLARAVKDALTGVVFAGHSQIVGEVIRKQYGDPERVEIVVREARAPAPLLEGCAAGESFGLGVG